MVSVLNPSVKSSNIPGSSLVFCSFSDSLSLLRITRLSLCLCLCKHVLVCLLNLYLLFTTIFLFLFQTLIILIVFSVVDSSQQQASCHSNNVSSTLAGDHSSTLLHLSSACSMISQVCQMRRRWFFLDHWRCRPSDNSVSRRTPAPSALTNLPRSSSCLVNTSKNIWSDQGPCSTIQQDPAIWTL